MNCTWKVVTLSPICQNSLSHVLSISNLNSSNFSVKFLEYLNLNFFQVILRMSFIIANQRNEQNLSISPWIEAAQSSFRKSRVSLHAFRVSQITKDTYKNKDKKKKKTVPSATSPSRRGSTTSHGFAVLPFISWYHHYHSITLIYFCVHKYT